MRRDKVFLVVGIIFTSELAWHLCKKWCRAWADAPSTDRTSKASSSVDELPRRNIAEVMFFTAESSVCRAHAISEKACSRDGCPVGHLRKLRDYIDRATKSLDVCMYILTCQSLSNAIVDAHERGVRVRMIMDRDMACNEAARTALFHRSGVPLKLEVLDGLMHHKFAIIDDDIAITGSTNWTMSAFFGNFEHILVTDHRPLVRPFVEEFARLWRAFSAPRESAIAR